MRNWGGTTPPVGGSFTQQSFCSTIQKITWSKMDYYYILDILRWLSTTDDVSFSKSDKNSEGVNYKINPIGKARLQ